MFTPRVNNLDLILTMQNIRPLSSSFSRPSSMPSTSPSSLCDKETHYHSWCGIADVRDYNQPSRGNALQRSLISVLLARIPVVFRGYLSLSYASARINPSCKFAAPTVLILMHFRESKWPLKSHECSQFLFFSI